MSPALLPTMPLAGLDALRRQLDQAYERWFDGEGRAWAKSEKTICAASGAGSR